MKLLTSFFKHIASVLMFMLTLLFLSAIMIVLLAFYLNEAPDTAWANGTVFSVRQNEPAVSVARRLSEQTLIRSQYWFRFLLKARGLETALQRGEYLIRSSMTSGEIIDMIAEGRQLLVKVTIPEGAGNTNIAKIAAEAGIASEEAIQEAIQSLAPDLGIAAQDCSGYLFPDTYFLPKSTDARDFIKLMAATFRKKLADAVPESSSLSAEELHNAVILASIVEREYRLPDEAPRIAGVFWNRLRIGMGLQSCATVVYIITEKQGKPHPKRLFERDIKIDDPFNTYIYAGLPPKPICNPGITALTAALRPAVSKYLYFRLIDEATGKHYFSETLDEHIQAAAFTVKPR